MIRPAPRYFKPQELFPRDKCREYSGRLDQLWAAMDPRILVTIDRLRERWGPLRINDWSQGGSLQYRGWRPGSHTGGAALSQHKFGRAVDISSWDNSMTADEMRADCLKNSNLSAFEFITRIESGMDAPTWFHCDCGLWLRDTGGILVVRG